MNIIGMDLGTSLAKIIECDKFGNIVNKMLFPEKSATKALEIFIASNNININDIEVVVATGVGASHIEGKEVCGIEVVKENEFLCIAKGGVKLSKKHEIIIASMGTGTAFVRVQGEDVKHLGGTAVGGGTIVNLCERFVGTKSFDEIVELASKGNLSKVDLVIGDITKAEIPGLAPDITACNFGKLSKEAKKEDIALGIINMVFEVIGMMGVFATKNDTIKDIVAVGSLTVVPYIETVFKKIEDMTGARFIIPENAEFAGCIGAVKKYIEKG